MTEKELYKVECEIEVAFTRLIGTIAIMQELELYKDICDELSNLFKTIVSWGAKFQIEKNLNFITKEELINIHNKIDKIESHYVYLNYLGNETELSDEILIWFEEIFRLNNILTQAKCC